MQGRQRNRPILVPALALVLAALCACGSDPRPKEHAPAGPVPRPPSVVATIAIRDVAEIARAVRSLAGPVLPAAAAGADARLWMAALADLPTDAAAVLAAHGDAYVLVLDGAPGRLAWALPLEGARDPASLGAADGRRARRAGHHYVIAPDVGALRDVASYVERTLVPQERTHAVTIVVDAAAAGKASDVLLAGVGAVAEELRAEAREMRVQMGRAPEIGEPEAVPGWVEDVGRRLALAAGDAAIEAAIDLNERALSVELDLQAHQGSALAADLDAASPGRIALLDHVPGDAALAVAVRRSPAERREASGRSVALLGRLAGTRLAPGEADALAAALSAWDGATAEEGAVALFGASPTVLVQSAAGQTAAAATAARAVAERLGQGHLALVGDRLGLWHGAPALEVAELPDRIALASGTDAAAVLSRSAGPSLAARREVAAVLADGGAHLVSVGSASPTALLALLAPALGERFAQVAAAARAGASSEHAVWSVRVQDRHLRVDLRVPPPELRALATALGPAGE